MRTYSITRSAMSWHRIAQLLKGAAENGDAVSRQLRADIQQMVAHDDNHRHEDKVELPSGVVREPRIAYPSDDRPISYDDWYRLIDRRKPVDATVEDIAWCILNPGRGAHERHQEVSLVLSADEARALYDWSQEDTPYWAVRGLAKIVHDVRDWLMRHDG